jgi:hypothetical protein
MQCTPRGVASGDGSLAKESLPAGFEGESGVQKQLNHRESMGCSHIRKLVFGTVVEQLPGQQLNPARVIFCHIAKT